MLYSQIEPNLVFMVILCLAPDSLIIVYQNKQKTCAIHEILLANLDQSASFIIFFGEQNLCDNYLWNFN